MEANHAFETEQAGGDITQQNTTGATQAIAEEDLLRAQLYGLLARVLALPMSEETLEIIRGLSETNSETEIGKALKGLGELASRTPRGVAEEEYSALFYGMGAGGELHPYASFYLTGFVYEKPLSNLRRDMAELGIARSTLNSEPEDHIAFLMEIMHGLISGDFGGGVGPERQDAFFNQHIAPWATHFFVDLEKAKNAKVYMPVGTIGKLFMQLERDAFEMAAV